MKTPEQLRSLDQLKKVSKLLDSQFEGPLGIKFGLDGILGFVPVVGDLVTTCVSLYIIVRSAKLGCSPTTLLRMAGNVALENLADSVPIVGNFFDIFWKANNKNVALLEAHIENPHHVTMKSRILIGLIITLIIGLFLGGAFLAYFMVKTIFDMFLVMN